ncbi:MAG: hypothetical protein JRI68_09175 [Deltaproteobacteria bacterium]|nr:hypothetical protein [Deltaproteobacteria bacterium]
MITLLVAQLASAPAQAAEPPAPSPPAGGAPPATETEEDGEDEPLDPYRVEPTIVPAFAGSSDIGFLFGAMGTLAQFDPAYDPYRWRGESVFVTAVKDGPDGAELTMQVYFLRLNFPELLGGALRLTPEVFFVRRINAGYFGLGNASRPGLSEAERTGPETGRVNQYMSTSPMVLCNAQIDMGYGLSALVGGLLRASFVDPYANSRLAVDASALDRWGEPLIRGVDPEGHGYGRLAAGGQFDSRDHETAPQRGMFHSLGGYLSPPGPMGSDHWFGGVTADARFFAPVIRDHLVAGLRVLGDMQFGDPPFYQLGQYGVFRDQGFTGSRGLRGPPQGRYHGRVKVLGNLELRAMFLSFMLFEQRWRFGASAVADAGRVWADYRIDPVLDGTGLGLKYGVGGGPRLQVGETVMIRIDAVYSPHSPDGYGDLPVGIYWDMRELF